MKCFASAVRLVCQDLQPAQNKTCLDAFTATSQLFFTRLLQCRRCCNNQLLVWYPSLSPSTQSKPSVQPSLPLPKRSKLQPSAGYPNPKPKPVPDSLERALPKPGGVSIALSIVSCISPNPRRSLQHRTHLRNSQEVFSTLVPKFRPNTKEWHPELCLGRQL